MTASKSAALGTRVQTCLRDLVAPELVVDGDPGPRGPDDPGPPEDDLSFDIEGEADVLEDEDLEEFPEDGSDATQP